ncbi:MAG: hypothetical protein WCP97_09860 [bacterium]
MTLNAQQPLQPQKDSKFKCTDCQDELVIPQKNEIGDLVFCKLCGAEYEVIKLNPIQLKLIEEEK